MARNLLSGGNAWACGHARSVSTQRRCLRRWCAPSAARMAAGSNGPSGAWAYLRMHPHSGQPPPHPAHALHRQCRCCPATITTSTPGPWPPSSTTATAPKAPSPAVQTPAVPY